MTNLLSDRPVILASASPRRLMLLRQIGIEPQVLPAEIKEISPRPDMPPHELVSKNSLIKALAAKKCLGEKDAWIIAADTVVAVEKTVLGKPKNPEEACRMLRLLSGRWHHVLSGLCLMDGLSGKQLCGCAITKVHFSQLSDEEILSYVKTGEPRDKAGSYGMQGQAALFVDRIEGDYSTVVGMSLPLLRKMLQKINQPEDRGH
ncbi:MAG: septum formation protein Maf [Firmicutes bacterium]|nr:septum formation protein Maf [Bacillota bacterium]